MVKNSPANAGDARDKGSIPRSGRSLRIGNGNHSSILTWKMSWTEDPGRLQSIGSQSQIRLSTCTHAHAHVHTRTHTHTHTHTESTITEIIPNLLPIHY